MDTDRCGRGVQIRVDEESVLARFADWHSQTIQRPVAAIGPETKDATLFIANEVIIDEEDAQLAQELVERFGAEVIEEPPLPPIPESFQRERHIELDKIPQPIRLRFNEPPRVDDVIPLLEGAIMENGYGDGEMTVTSEMGAAIAALVTRYALEGRPIGLNLLGHPFRMPMSTATESTIPGASSDPTQLANPFAWQAFSGRTRIVDAWQLVDSIRQIRGDQMVIVAILDRGFWLDNTGAPFVAAGQGASDFGAGVMQLNLSNQGKPVGGMNPSGFAWHGNAVASVVAAAVNNNTGAAGSSGNTATPMLFLTDISIDQMMYCARTCAAWGIDVLNMSIGTWGQSEFWFPTSAWDRAFQFAYDNGVVMIAAAGNFGVDLPDNMNIRPATRTPGVLTVGALEPDDTARRDSNYGSSVWLWAPGRNIPVMPDGNSPNGGLFNQTSAAAPMVAGVAAMMRYANNSLSAAEIIRILMDTAWPGTGRVSRGLDAYAAVLAAINQTLPDYSEPNNTPSTARDLIPTSGGSALAPGFNGFASRSRNGDTDYWKFRVERFSTVTVSLDFYERLSSLYMAVEAEDPDTRGPEEMTRAGSSQSGRISLTGLLPPGTYRVRIGGSSITAYRLLVTRRAAQLPGDIFEKNDSSEQAARMLFQTSKWGMYALRTWGPGTFDATLHEERYFSPVIGGGMITRMNDDYFRLKVPASTTFTRPTVAVFDADQPVDVTLYDEARQAIQSWIGVKQMKAIPPYSTTCYLKVSGKKPTRYRISTNMRADPAIIPGPLQEEVEIFPKWWSGPPPLRLKDILTHYVIEMNGERSDGDGIVFEQPSEAAIRLELLNREGEVVREAEAVDGVLRIDTQNMDQGTYVLRIAKAGKDAGSLVNLRIVPPLR